MLLRGGNATDVDHVAAAGLELIDQHSSCRSELHVGHVNDADLARQFKFRNREQGNLVREFLDDGLGMPANHVTAF